MKNKLRVAQFSFLLALIAIASGCIVGPREGTSERDPARLAHEQAWHACNGGTDYCR